MRCEAKFHEKATFKECYVTDRNINLMDLDRINELNLVQSPDENDICKTPTLEPSNAENLVTGLQRGDRKDQDISLHVPPGFDGILIVSRSVS
ncbi:unnamed protein product [Hymenolepis diminuta]|uniref:Uncharacterized protein n=1 Tax=Hymenolepis diminuta TaxID=6216 RepID=A0A564YPW3_HYMDI|nr:unnamed protein product [Hymenolepis diminuta]